MPTSIVELEHIEGGGSGGSILKSREYKTGSQAVDLSGVGTGPWQFTLTNSYTVGSNNLFVYNGALLTNGVGKDYQEIDSTHINLLYEPNAISNLNFIVYENSTVIRETQIGSQAVLTGGKYRFTLLNPYTAGKMEMYIGALLTVGQDYDEVDSTHVDLNYQPNINNNVNFKIFS